jgi:hypothetical protein
VGHADVALRLSGGALGEFGLDAVAPHQQRSHVGDGRHLQAHWAHARPDRGNQVGLARCAEDPHGALGRFLELLQQEVRRLLGHAIGVFDDDHPVPADRRRVVRSPHDLTHVVALDDHALGREHVQVGMASRLDLDARGVVAIGRPRDERGGERVGQVRATRSGRSGDEPRVRHLLTGAAPSLPGCRIAHALRGDGALGRRAEHGDRLLLPGQLRPHTHAITLPSAPDDGL